MATRIKSLISSLNSLNSLTSRTPLKSLKLLLGVLLTLVVAGGLFFYFSRSTSAAWYNTSWAFRKKLVIDNTKVSGSANLSSFPVYISITDLDLKQHAQSDGDDILFTDSAGNKLDHEIEKYTSSTGQLLAWVEVTTVYYNTDTEFYMYYGNPGASSQQNASGTWNSNYAGVWHLKEDPSGTPPQMADSTGTNNGTSGGTMTSSDQVTGKIDGSLDFDGTNDYISATQNSTINNLTALTVSAWIYPRSLGESSFGRIVGKAAGTTLPTAGWIFTMSNNDGNTLQFAIEYPSTHMEVHAGTSAITLNQWQHVVVIWDGSTTASNVKFYVNGVESTPHSWNGNGSGTRTSDAAQNLLIGSNPATSRTFNGIIDQVEVSNTNRTGDWVITEYNNQSSPSTFVSFSSQERGPGTPVLHWGFNSAQESTAYDNSVYKNNGTLGTGTSAPTWDTSSFIGKPASLKFDGTNDYVSKSYSNDVELDVGTSSFSLDAWFRHSSNISGTDTLISRASGTLASEVGYKVYMNSSGYICFGIDDTAGSFPADSACSTTSYADSKWHHLEATKNGTTSITLYIDGVQVAQTTSLNSLNSLSGSSPTLYVGIDSDGASNPWDGNIDEVRVFDVLRSAAEVKTDFNSRGSVRGVSASFGDSRESEKLSEGLVAWWKMDENTGSSTSDSSGNNNNSTTWTGATWSAGKFGSATSFDGSDQTVRFAETSSTDLGAVNSSYTVSAWFKTSTDYSTPGCIVCKITNGSIWPFKLYMNTSEKIFFQLGETSVFPYAQSSNTYNDGVWHQAVGIRDGLSKKLYLYVDGIFAGSGTDTTTGDISNNIDISVGNGATSYTTQDFTGQIDEVRIYNRALSPSEAQALYDWAPPPVGEWKMDEKTGTSAYDTSGNENTLTLTNSPTWTTGKFGSGIAFAGSNAQLYRDDDSDFDFTAGNSFTLETWIKHDTATTQEIIMSKYNEAGYKLIMESDGDITCGIDYDSTWTPADSVTSTAATYDDNAWHHIACVKNANTSLTLYIDGVSVGTPDTSLTNSTLANSDPLYLGIDADGTSNDWIGSLDNAKIYNYARTQKQIISDMNAGHPAVGSPVGSAVGEWKFDEGYGSTTYDQSVNSNDGTLGTGSSAPSWTNSGKFGKALSFDGTDDYVNVSDSTSLSPTTGVTVSAWVKSSTAGRYIIAKDPPAPPTLSNGEIPDERTYNQKVFYEGGDTRRAQIHVGDIHYKDPITDKFDEIDTTLIPNLSGGWRMNKASYHLNLPKYANDWFDFVNNYEGDKEDDVSIKALGVAPVTGQLVTYDSEGWSNKQILYKNAFGNNTDLVLRARNTGFDKLVVINQKPQDLTKDPEYSFEVNLNGFKITDGNGKVWDEITPLVTSDNIILEKLKKTWFRKFTVWDSNGNQQNIKVRFERNPSGTYTLTKIVPRDFLQTAVYPVYTDTTTSYYAGAGDGYISATNASWDTAHDAATGGSANYTATNGSRAWSEHWANYIITRGFFPIDTSGIPAAATISSATFYATVQSASTNVASAYDWVGVVQTSQASSTTLATADYDQDGAINNPTEGSDSRFSIASLSADTEYSLALNATGLGWIKKSSDSPNCGSTNGITCLGIRQGHDASDVAISGSSVYSGTSFYTSEQTGTSNDPYIDITYTVTKTDVPFALSTVSGGQFLIMSSSTSYTATNGGTSINDGTWHHIVGTYDTALGQKLYIDGVLVDTDTTYTGNLPSVSGDIRIGADYQYEPANFFDGTIDEVRVYNYALNADEIKVDYNGGKAAVLGALSDNSNYQPNAASQAYCIPGDSSTCNPPVAEYKFDEGSGTTANDTSGNGITATLNSGSAHWVNAKYGKGFDFYESTKDCFNTTYNSLTYSATGLTVSTWYKTTDSTNNTGFLVSKADTAASNNWILGRSAGANATAFFSINNNTYTATSTTDITDGKWHYLTGLFDGSNVRIYIDGKLEATTGSASMNADTTQPIAIRGNATCASGTNYTNGMQDDVVIYNYARTPAQIAWDYNRGAPVAWYKFDECTGTTANNSAPDPNGGDSGNDGTITIGAGTTNTSAGTCTSGSSSEAWYNGAIGKFNASLDFDGSDDYVSITDPGTGSILDPVSEITVSTWVNPTTIDANEHALVEKGYASAWELSIDNNGGLKVNTYHGGAYEGDMITAPAGTVTASQWQHVVWTYNGTETKIYLNGEVVVSANKSGNLGTNNSNVYLASRAGNSQFLNGSIDDVRIYNYALTAEQIKLLYNNDKAVRF